MSAAPGPGSFPRCRSAACGGVAAAPGARNRGGEWRGRRAFRGVSDPEGWEGLGKGILGCRGQQLGELGGGLRGAEGGFQVCGG